MTSKTADLDLDTRLIHAGKQDHHGAVTTPIFQSSTFTTPPVISSYEDIRYIRLNNTPNHAVLATRLAALEGAAASLVAGSGMAAISATLMAVLSPGDHLLATDCLYGGSLALLTEELPMMGVEVDFIDGRDPASWERALRPNTRALWTEPMTNPLLQVLRLDELAKFARAHELVSMVDNTFCSPINYRPLEHGFDLCVHSATKYLNGHSDIVAGCVSGSKEHITRINKRLTHLGGSLDPHAAFLLERGLKTLAVRVRHQNALALEVARWLDAHPKVTQVNYPGLTSHPDHEHAARYFEGFGGVLSFELEGQREQVIETVMSLDLPMFAPSLGGPEALITLPSLTSHASISAEQRRAIGISDTLVRLSVGLESARDLIADFERALTAHAS